MIGVAISTRNRRPLFERSFTQWRRFMPAGSVCVVVDDASDTPLFGNDDISNGSYYRLIVHENRLGVAMTKNDGIAALMDAGCEHLFLADDDVYPQTSQWWKPYVESPEPHLSYQWPRPGGRWKIEHRDGVHFSLSFPRGVLLYAQRRVIDTVGGMDPSYGAWGGEHVEWSQRIYDAGLTSWRFADVCGSDKLWHSLDQRSGNSIGSSFPIGERRKMAKACGEQWGKRRDSPFVSYRQQDGWQDYGLGPYITREGHRYALLEYILGMHPAGAALEFGVGCGESTRLIAKEMPVYGFDSFKGLPTAWRPGFPAGMFATDEIPAIDNATMVVGLFEDTVADFRMPPYVGLVHLDADLYSSTATALDGLRGHLQPGCYVVFDEWWGYPGSADHEELAWREFAADTGISWTVVGHDREQWAIRIT